MDEGVSLRDYQVADLCYYMKNPRCLNLSDPGTGKTPSVVVCQWWLWSEHQCGTAFVMPLSLLKKNRDEILRFTHFKPDEVTIVTGMKPLWPTKSRGKKPPRSNPAREAVEKLRQGITEDIHPATLASLKRQGIVDDDLNVDEDLIERRNSLPIELVHPGNT
jgi:hypothetical protein